MSKVTLSLLSISIGFALGLSLAGSHTVTLAHASGGAISPVAPPIIPPISGTVASTSLSDNRGSGPQTIDGVSWKDCDFGDTDIEYNGGNVIFENIKFSGKPKLVLNGAAANTVRFIAFWQAFTSGQRPVPPNPNAPIMKTASVTLKQPVLVSFSTK